MNTYDYDKCTALWKEYEPHLRMICNRKLKSCPDEIDDVIAEVFLALCEKATRGDFPIKPKNWLYGTLNNTINLKYREIYKTRERQEPLSSNEYKLSFEQDTINKKTEEIFFIQLKNRIKIILTEDEYQFIQSVYFDKLKMKEMADLHNTTEAAMKQKHYRIRKKLKAAAEKL